MFTDLPSATNIRNDSTICVTSFNISWDVSSGIMCGVVSYEVSISPPPIEGNAVATTLNKFFNVTRLNNNLPNVTVTVTAMNRATGTQGIDMVFTVQLPKSLGIHSYNVSLQWNLCIHDTLGPTNMYSVPIMKVS